MVVVALHGLTDSAKSLHSANAAVVTARKGRRLQKAIRPRRRKRQGLVRGSEPGKRNRLRLTSHKRCVGSTRLFTGNEIALPEASTRKGDACSSNSLKSGRLGPAAR